GGRRGATARVPGRSRRRLLGDNFRRLYRAELSRNTGRARGGGRGLLALEGIQHDRLALCRDRRKRRRRRSVLEIEDERRLRHVRGNADGRRSGIEWS